jgi:hypothetical protein
MSGTGGSIGTHVGGRRAGVGGDPLAMSRPDPHSDKLLAPWHPAQLRLIIQQSEEIQSALLEKVQSVLTEDQITLGLKAIRALASRI